MGGHARELTAAALAALIFFDVAGTPAGIEDAIVAAGPLYCLIGLIVFPLVWSVPEALICAELGTMFPEDAGFVAWVAAAFGTRAGYVEGTLSYLSGVTDNAIYPVFIVQYIRTLTTALDDGVAYHCTLAAVIVALTILNYLGLKIVGVLSVGLLVFSLAPFVVMVFAGIPKMDFHRISEQSPGFDHIDWSLFLNTLFWNLNYFDSVSTLAAEVVQPVARTFSRALAAGVAIIVIMYFVVVAAATSISPEGTDWEATSLSNVAHIVGGEWLQTWTVIAIAASSIGLFQAEMTTDSYQLLGMAERGMLPLVFAKRSRFGTPTAGILLGAAFLSVCALLSLSEIIELLNLLYCFAALLEFAAFLWLRFQRPELDRPLRLPLSNVTCVVMLLPTFAFTVTIVCLASWKSYVITAASFVVSALVIVVCEQAKKRNWLEFAPDCDWSLPLPEDGICRGHQRVPGDDDTAPLVPAQDDSSVNVSNGRQRTFFFDQAPMLQV
eukprot:m.169981 g.169981  ORF g.169981 m.169981 type:complete len:495 (-) comp17819_c0_seq3:62-1546(-)